MTPRESDALLDDEKPSYDQRHLSIGYSGSEESTDGNSEETPQTTNLSRGLIGRFCPRGLLCGGAAAARNENDGDNDANATSGGTRKAWLLVVLVLSIAAVSSAVSDRSGVNTNRDTTVTWLRSELHTLAEALANKTATNASSTTNANDSGDTPPAAIEQQGTGPYEMIEAHTGKSFFDYYEFSDGPDSVGSAGYNTYVGRQRAEELKLATVVEGGDGDESGDDELFVVLSSKSGTTDDEHGNRFRESIRLEGKRRFDHGLILLDVDRMPTGCGVWPAFWTTDEAHWPDNGEIDIVEPINNQRVAKTALHTSQGCDMFAHVPRWNWTGHWDSATGLPDTFTGEPNFDTTLEADNCWSLAPHQWANQGCVAIHENENTLGEPMNEGGGGIYALEWDPSNGYIRSWVFPRHTIPDNLKAALAGGGGTDGTKRENKPKSAVRPDPSLWPTPYAYFAIGAGSGCPAENFRHHRLVINLAFCGAVAGNRFASDCPALYDRYNVRNDSVATCNAYLESDEGRSLLDEEAYWKIKGVHLYQREHEH